MSLNPATFEEAKEAFKPMRRTPMPRNRGITSSAVCKARKSPTGKKAKRVKKLTGGQLKKRAWKEFSIFIRTEGADSEGFNCCVTCGVRKHWKELQAGHFIRGRLNANLFAEQGCWPQCYSCNVGAQGNVVFYYKWMLSRFGQGVIDDLIAQNVRTRKWLPGELKALWDKYKELNKENPLVNEK